jgi:hypothetical protein
MAPYVLRHRIVVTDETTPDEVLMDALSTVPAPDTPPVSPLGLVE